MKKLLFLPAIVLLLLSCSNDEPAINEERSFQMGFTTWTFGPNPQDVNETYAFIGENSDIYAEHIDSNIPWNAWINDLSLPEEFSNEIAGRVNRRLEDKQLLLSVSLLNLSREELAFDFDGSIPSYSEFDDTAIKEAYFKHINYLVNQFEPDYLVIAIEVNELGQRAPEKWAGYKSLMLDVKTRVKQAYPELQISESLSLHNLTEHNVSAEFVQDVFQHVNQNDFIAISYYPFFNDRKSTSEYQEVFDFLHSKADIPIAFVETAHIAEDLIVPNFNFSITGNQQTQDAYLQSLFNNADNQNYEFIIWWAHRDFDALWEIFPDDVKDLGQLWRDTGLLDENGVERSAFATWSDHYRKRLIE